MELESWGDSSCLEKVGVFTVKSGEINMNRGFRDAAAPRRVVTKEADEELALFLEMRKLEKQRNNLLLHNAGELDPPFGNVGFRRSYFERNTLFLTSVPHC